MADFEVQLCCKQGKKDKKYNVNQQTAFVKHLYCPQFNSLIELVQQTKCQGNKVLLYHDAVYIFALLGWSAQKE